MHNEAFLVSLDEIDVVHCKVFQGQAIKSVEMVFDSAFDACVIAWTNLLSGSTNTLYHFTVTHH